MPAAEDATVTEATRDRRRLTAMAVIALVTVAGALGFGRLVDRSAERALAEAWVSVGDFAVRMPAGWVLQPKVSNELLARSADDDAAVTVYSFRPDAPLGAPELTARAISRQTYAEPDRLRIVEIEPPRPVDLAGGKGLIATYGYTLNQSWIGTLRGGDVFVYRTIVAGVVDGNAVVIELDRLETLEATDTLLVRAMARNLRRL